MIAAAGLTVRQIIQVKRTAALGLATKPEFIVVVDPKEGFVFAHKSL
jgi:hypothetical protein